jgi:carbon monoxide dehydrogenase subunit G
VTTFSVTTSRREEVASPPERVWAALTDTDLLARLTPYLQRIDVDGDRWTWHLTRIPLLGSVVSPSFTEVMSFDEPTRIDFVHDPSRTDEKAGVTGNYLLRQTAEGTDLSIRLSITVDLPLPGLARPAVQAGMHAVVATMGARFAHNFVRHLAKSS